VRPTESEYTPGPSGYDAELRRRNQVLRRAAGVQPHDHTLDIGCGTGQTTRQAARTAQAGSALGVDVSAPAIECATGQGGLCKLWCTQCGAGGNFRLTVVID
jgi:ubiquinone/menaquinone biosynthesis C-methylase UbiE